MGIEIGPPKRVRCESEVSIEKLIEFPIIEQVGRKLDYNMMVLRRILFGKGRQIEKLF